MVDGNQSNNRKEQKKSAKREQSLFGKTGRLSSNSSINYYA